MNWGRYYSRIHSRFSWTRRTPIVDIDAAIAAINVATPGAIPVPVGATPEYRRGLLDAYARTQARNVASPYTPAAVAGRPFPWGWVGGVATIAGLILIAFLAWKLIDDNIGNDGTKPASGDQTATPTPRTSATQTPVTRTIQNVIDDLKTGKITQAQAIEEAKKLGGSDAQIQAAIAALNPQPTPRTGVIPASTGSNGNKLDGGRSPSYNSEAFRHPKQFVACQKTFSPVADQVDWLLCEPGVLLTNTATFTRPEVDAIYHTNCPEGGFWYGSMHHGTILLPDSVGGVRLELKDYGSGTNHLLVIRCRLSDGKRDSDLNFTMKVGNFVIGHAIWSPIPAAHPDGSAYVSMEWFGEQIITSHTTGGTNCGSDGCSKVYVNLYDVNSQSWQEFLVTNIKGESVDSDKDGIVDYASGDWQVISTNR